jgi:hypothetical protein
MEVKKKSFTIIFHLGHCRFVNLVGKMSYDLFSSNFFG